MKQKNSKSNAFDRKIKIIYNKKVEVQKKMLYK